MKSRSFFALLAVVLSQLPTTDATSATAPKPKCCVPIEISVTRDAASVRGTKLNVKLTNRSMRSIEVGPVQSPWAGPSMLKVIGVRLPQGTPIENKLSAIVEPSPISESLAPNASVSDQIDLSDMYPEVAKAILDGRQDLVLFWTYKFKFLDGEESEQLAGWLFVKSSR